MVASAPAFTPHQHGLGADRVNYRRQLAQIDLMVFTRRMFPAYQSASHLFALTAALERVVATPGGRLIVTMPPRHSKSLHVSEHLPAWYLGRFPDRRIIAAANTAELAYTFSRRVRNLFDSPRWPFPDVRVATDKAAVRAWDIDGTRGGVIALGIGGTPTGHGANLLAIDDPFRSASDADSATVRDSIWEWYQGTIRTRLEPSASIVVTATRWHEQDLTGRLLTAAESGGEHWDHLYLPAISDDGQALWPERWPVAELLRTKAAIGARAWESQFQGRPSPAEGAILKREWWGWYDPTDLPTFDRMIQAWDTAYKSGTANDYSVGTTWGQTKNGYYLLDLWRDRAEFPALKRAVVAQYVRWQPEAVYVEDAASGQSLNQELAANTRMPVVPVPVTRDKIARANAISPTIEAGKVKLPRGATWVDAFVEECAGFPFAAHDDQVDSLTLALGRLIGAAPIAPVSDDLRDWFTERFGS